MATKSGRSTTGTRKEPGRATKSVKLPAKRSKAGAKRGSAKKVPSKEVIRGAKANAREPKFFMIFKAVAPQDLYVVPVYEDDKVTDDNAKTCLEAGVGKLAVTVKFAYLVKKADDEPFRTCGPSHP